MTDILIHPALRSAEEELEATLEVFAAAPESEASGASELLLRVRALRSKFHRVC
jgi:hypothetical protein